jgi:epoxyqueuosine reductase
MADALIERNARLKAEARRLGFDLVGVTTPDSPPHLDVYERWLAAGRHGEMAYMATERARQRRADPRRIVPGCRSIVVVGMNCLPDARPDLSAHPMRIAAYARGRDYHGLMLERIEALGRFLQAEAREPVAYRAYVDTGPLLERELAQRAGLGWVGKNTCLINPSHGSHFLLGELLVTLALERDAPFEADRCGSCTRCLDACPTACILPDRTLDARRCISYLTIELRGAIPEDLRPEIGDWLFGCDICQQVCPWNLRFAGPTLDPAFRPRAELVDPQASRFLSLSEAGFLHEFEGSPLLRPGRRGMARNAAVAAGNRGDRSTVPALASALANDPEPLVRGHAAWGLGRIGSPEARHALEQAAILEADPAVSAEIATAQERLGPAESASAGP